MHILTPPLDQGHQTCSQNLVCGELGFVHDPATDLEELRRRRHGLHGGEEIGEFIMRAARSCQL